MYNLLIVEDIDIIRNMLARDVNWGSLGVQISGTASNGVQALSIMKENTPDILISDIKMPMMDGFRLLMEVHEKYPAVKSIILTAYSDFNYAQNAIRLGVIDYVLKPVEEEELLAAVRKAVACLEKEKLQQRGKDGADDIEVKKLWEQNTESSIISGVSSMKSVKMVERAREYIENNILTDITLSQVADAAYLNPNYLNKLFKQFTGESIHQYIIRCKMKKAAELLLDPTVKVYEVSEKVGYQDQKHFSSTFAKCFGINPSEYRSKVV